MIKRALALGLASLVIFSISMPSSNAATKTGTACGRAGQGKIVNGIKYTCTRSSSKLHWVIARAIQKQLPAHSPVVVNPAEACKLPNGSGVRPDVAIGWPRIANRMNTMGVLNVKVIMVDFSDAVATRSPVDAFAFINPGAADTFQEMSYGRMTYKMDPTLKWYRMSQPSSSYSFSTFLDQKSYIQEAVQLASHDVDFSKVDSFIVLANPDAPHLTFGPAFTPLPGNGVTIQGNYLGNGATSSHDILTWGSIWLNHEISHTLGLVDLYAFTELNNSYDSIFRFTGDFSYMGSLSSKSNSRSLLAWERWLLGWIDDSQIHCQISGISTTTLTPIERSGGTKALIVPTGNYTAVVVESRRAEGLDKNMTKTGVLVYSVDTSIASGFGPIQIQNAKPNDLGFTQSPLAMGETLTIGTVTVKVATSDSTGDIVNVTVAN